MKKALFVFALAVIALPQIFADDASSQPKAKEVQQKKQDRKSKKAQAVADEQKQAPTETTAPAPEKKELVSEADKKVPEEMPAPEKKEEKKVLLATDANRTGTCPACPCPSKKDEKKADAQETATPATPAEAPKLA